MAREERTVAGYLWVDHAAPEHERAAEVGGRVRLPELRPPWLVVYETPGRVLVNRWPGRLLHVETVPAASEAERSALAEVTARIVPGAGYTNAVCVDVVAELSPALPFGTYGEAVVRVVEAALALDEPTAHRLAEARHRDAEDACRAAWRRWSEQPKTWGVGSPVGSGFGLLHRLVRDSARERGGQDAWVVDGDGDEEAAEPWRSAYGALREAAMAHGAPDLCDSAARTAMSTAWNAVYGPMPG
ncbi:hypothetical protein Cs7R123_02460 [Catellatospora sp. TT07R-123]|uniref:hypothetical protein n=1 Tax=Catellatospora sp. TT07R-123 TaxID=2733863 RepID=UPI001B14CCA9|nr:hypothetical protein [Catellatospora sp. TT07R-123]GHJ42904.1 hypothetical protein Cs7R123_02460 [Catellatospora sp. TT07R-123]